METTAQKNDPKVLYYFQITDIWKRLCELHSELFDQTAEEYTHLLASDFDSIESITRAKSTTVSEINKINSLREEIIQKIESEPALAKGTLSNSSKLIEFFQDCPPEEQGRHLWRFNRLLLDIIGKIQDQHKKNQLFINKAIHSLREIREGVFGEDKLQIYNSKGGSQSLKSQRY